MTGHTTPFFDDYSGGPSIEKARKLLAEAGVSLPVHIDYRRSCVFRRIASLGARYDSLKFTRTIQYQNQTLT
jgi:hypothetical protein